MMAIVDPAFSIFDCRECNHAALAYSVWLMAFGSSHMP